MQYANKTGYKLIAIGLERAALVAIDWQTQPRIDCRDRVFKP